MARAPRSTRERSALLGSTSIGSRCRGVAVRFGDTGIAMRVLHATLSSLSGVRCLSRSQAWRSWSGRVASHEIDPRPRPTVCLTSFLLL